MSLKNIMLSKKKPIIKCHILHKYFYVKYQTRQIHGEKVDQSDRKFINGFKELGWRASRN